MKLTSYNTRFKHCLRGAAALLLAAAAIGCQKDAELDLPLAVNANKLNMAAKGGSTHIMIYSAGEWNVRFDEQVDWGALSALAGTGNSEVVFSFSENLEAPRRVNLIVTNSHGIDTVKLIQAGIDAKLAFGKTEAATPNNATRVYLPFTTNLVDQARKIRLSMYDPDVEVVEEQKREIPEWVDLEKHMSFVTDKDGKITYYTVPLKANTTGKSRRLRVALGFTDGNDKFVSSTTIVTQTSETPRLAFLNREQEISRAAGTASIRLVTNLAASTILCKKEVSYPDGTTPWIKEVRADGANILCDVNENTTGTDRKASIAISYTSADGKTLTDNVTLLQNNFDLRAMIAGASGRISITEDITFEGIVISDAGNANLELNPNITLKSVDFTENDKTAYIQRENGAYGFRLKFDDAADNTLKRYSKVVINLKGLTLIKEATPARYTISGLTAVSIRNTEAGEASDLYAKERRIADLSDEDVYTFVTLKDVQIGINDGAYTNVNDGYTKKDATLNPNGTDDVRVDCSPLAFFDKGGDHIYMLVNMLTPWRRTGSGVPAGSGDLKGILVHSKTMRYGPGNGNIGTYSLRVLEEKDIALNPTDGFASTLVEWNWNGGQNQPYRNTDGTLMPDVGKGSLYSTFKTSPSTSWGYYGIASSFNDKTNTGIKPKGELANTAVHFNCDQGSWWDFTANKGEAIVAKFSTSGISASQLILIFDIGAGSGDDSNLRFPTNWRVEYSFDGVNYSTVSDGGKICVRPQTWWTARKAGLDAGVFCTPGLINYAVKLPAGQLSGKDEIYIALRPVSTACAWYFDGANYPKPNAEDAESNTLTKDGKGSGSIRMSTFSIRYF